jgi:hypothetical protein
MANKIHTLTTINDIANLINDENKEFLIADLVSSLNAIVDIKERYLKEAGKYPTDFIEYIEIIFDGKVAFGSVDFKV